MSTKVSNNLIGITGEYLVCGELGKRNVLGLLSPKNTPLYDIVATNPLGTHTVHIQVKTMASTNKTGWKLGKTIEHLQENPLLFMVLVRLKGLEEPPDFYIYRYDDLSRSVTSKFAKYMSILKRNGEKRKKTDMRCHNFNEFTEEDHLALNNWSLLGF